MRWDEMEGWPPPNTRVPCPSIRTPCGIRNRCALQLHHAFHALPHSDVVECHSLNAVGCDAASNRVASSCADIVEWCDLDRTTTGTHATWTTAAQMLCRGKGVGGTYTTMARPSSALRKSPLVHPHVPMLMALITLVSTPRSTGIDGAIFTAGHLAQCAKRSTAASRQAPRHKSL